MGTYIKILLNANNGLRLLSTYKTFEFKLMPFEIPIHRPKVNKTQRFENFYSM